MNQGEARRCESDSWPPRSRATDERILEACKEYVRGAGLLEGGTGRFDVYLPSTGGVAAWGNSKACSCSTNASTRRAGPIWGCSSPPSDGPTETPRPAGRGCCITRRGSGLRGQTRGAFAHGRSGRTRGAGAHRHTSRKGVSPSTACSSRRAEAEAWLRKRLGDLRA